MIYDLTYDIIGQCSIRLTAALRPPRCGSGPAASLRRFLVSAALVLLSLIRSALILSASTIDTIRGPMKHGIRGARPSTMATRQM